VTVERRHAPDLRREAEVLAELADAARRAALPPELAGPERATWADLLFAADGSLRDQAEPSQALLLALARVHQCLIDHFNKKPEDAARWYFEQRLGILPLSAEPDRVAVLVEGDPRRLPVLLPARSVIVAGKNLYRGERLYETVEPLTVLGTTVVGLHSHRIYPDHDVVVRRAGTGLTTSAPYHPFGRDGDVGAVAAPHQLYIASDLLRFTRGELHVTLTFRGVADKPAAAAMLPALVWEMSAPLGHAPAGIPAVLSSSADEVKLDFSLQGGSAPQPLLGAGRVYLRAGFPAAGAPGFDRGQVLAFQCSEILVKVQGVSVPPESGAYNGGALDLTKEFAPFGPVPHRGDSFYLQLDEAFEKPLTSLGVSLELQQAETPGGPSFTGVAYQPVGYQAYLSLLDALNEQFSTAYELTQLTAYQSAPTSEVQWQRLRAGDWEKPSGAAWASGQFASLSASVGETVPFSDPTEVAGRRGRFVRAFLSRGDFGWNAYLARLADDAPTAGPPPDPPVVTRVRINYTTQEHSNRNAGELRLFRCNGLAAPVEITSDLTLRPYEEDPSGHRGALYLGLSDPPQGEVVTCYFQVEEADACGAIDDAEGFAWEYSAPGSQWQGLDVLDSTQGLRQAGILRFVAPLDWATGAAAAHETAGRWLRARTTAPQSAGTLRSVACDAVEAVYRLAAGHATDDPTPAEPLPARSVKSLKRAVAGIKGVSNAAPSIGGRGPESPGSFLQRAGGELRHRGRPITPWDVEELVRSRFPQVALVRCLPHHSADSECAPGWISLVVVPRSPARLPQPTVQLATLIKQFLRERGTPHLRVAVLCAAYQEACVETTIRLRRDVPAGQARRELDQRLRAFLHPLSAERAGAEFGRGLFLSVIARFLEEQPEVAYVASLTFAGRGGAERIDVDGCRGLVASAESHLLRTEAAL
jgi:hypothetical protein